MNSTPQTGAVLGNGPSRAYFDRKADIVIGCNIPDDQFSVDATVISDIEVVWVLKNNPELISCPLIVSVPAYEKVKELKIDSLFDYWGMFPVKDWHNSGHYAALYLSNISKCDKIFLWGCDSYFKDVSESLTDKHLPKSGDMFYKQWRNTWHDIITTHPQIHYTLVNL